MTSSPLGWLYERLNQAALNGITISLVRPYQYQDRVALEESGVRAEVRVIYEKRGLITRFELVSGNENLFGKTVEAITSYYNWNTEPGEAAL
ncbi:hypothetical protein [Adlercreutzia muris]|uniref:hypothetical protein n=1 Tax=Adlercreutzia muris TaxID=1796610 RepID=UPI003F792356